MQLTNERRRLVYPTLFPTADEVFDFGDKAKTVLETLKSRIPLPLAVDELFGQGPTYITAQEQTFGASNRLVRNLGEMRY